MMNDVCSYVVTMSAEDGLNYLLALSGGESSRGKLKRILDRVSSNKFFGEKHTLENCWFDIVGGSALER